MIRYIRSIFFHVIGPLLAGSIVYILFRNGTWAHQVFPFKTNNMSLIAPDNRLARAMAFHFPDFCWSYSLASALFIWKKWAGVRIPYFAVYVWLLLACSEIVQYWFPKQFTVDLADLLAAVLAFFLSYALNGRDETT